MSLELASKIQIRAQVDFREEFSNNKDGKYVFTYEISILNNSQSRVQLLRRYWHIRDSLGTERVVEGEGVIGEQPTLEPGAHHSYSSWCPLQSDTGSMEGHYVFLDLESLQEFEVQIPEFSLIPSYKLN